MTLIQFIRQAFDDVINKGWTPEKIAILANDFHNLAFRIAFSKTPEQIIAPYLRHLYRREIESGKVLQRNKGLGHFTYERIKPEFRRLLEDRIKANIDLITMERPNAVDVATTRFSGWLMSFDGTQEKLPPAKELPAFKNILKPITEQKNYEHSRRAIDQGHKMLRAIDSVIAEQGGAVAGVWHAHPKTSIYDARKEHWARDGKVYIYKNSDLVKQGLVKKGNEPWVEDITDPPAFLINCTCYFSNIYSLSQLAKIAPDRITQKGKDKLNELKNS